ncbi:hypothetical protein B0H13DRAFT_2275554 [Mycena leptocephala]|nr:hypothetical protein B0H13DRAFT_2275554 [Mycena leptocephala]
MDNSSNDAQFASLYGRSPQGGTPSIASGSGSGSCQPSANTEPCSSLNSYIGFCAKHPGTGPCTSSGMLMSGAKDDSDPALQRAHLIALTSLIKAIPNAASCRSSSRAPQLPDLQIRANAIETLLAASAMGTHASVLAEHAPALVRTLLGYTKATSAPTSTGPHHVPALLGGATYAVLHPCKPEVLRELGDALDDPKRGVRREAVDAREVCTMDERWLGADSLRIGTCTIIDKIQCIYPHRFIPSLSSSPPVPDCHPSEARENLHAALPYCVAGRDRK